MPHTINYTTGRWQVSHAIKYRVSGEWLILSSTEQLNEKCRWDEPKRESLAVKNIWKLPTLAQMGFNSSKNKIYLYHIFKNIVTHKTQNTKYFH